MRRHELTDEEWATLEPLLPPSRPATGRPNKNHRTILNGILWILRTGAPWRDLPERYGSWRTVYSRFRRWQQAGVWDRVLTAVCVSIEPPVRWRAYRFAPSGPMSCSLHRQPHSTSGLNLYEYRCKKFGIRAEVLAAGK